MAKEPAGIDAAMVEAMETFAGVAETLGLPVLVIGATARMLLLEQIYGLDPGRRTRDVDYAVAVESWADDLRLRAALVDTGLFEPDKRRAQRLYFRQSVTVDVIPVGGVEDESGELEWQGDDGTRLNVLGLAHLIPSAISVGVGKVQVPVVSPEGLLAVKLIAWRERGREEQGRDVADIGYVLRNAEEIVGINTLYQDHEEAVVAADYQLDIAATCVLGERLAATLPNSVRGKLRELLKPQMQEDSPLVRDMLRYSGFTQATRGAELFDAFLRGLSTSV